MLNIFRGVVAGLLLAGTGSPVQAQVETSEAQEIVIVANRIGVPVWRISSPTTTLVLVGSIESVAKDTKWNSTALTEALRKADRVMFPDMVGISISPFRAVGYLVKWRKQATLPRGQSLSAMLPPAQYRRLSALHDRGLIKSGFEKKHPLHLAMALRDIAEGKAGLGPSAGDYVRQTAKKHKIRMVPIAKAQAKQVANDFFSTPPRAYLPCLMDSVALIEAGPGAVKARSDAWAQRKVQAVLGSPAEAVQESCLPPAFAVHKPQDLSGAMRDLLNQKPLTVAVIGLKSLARPGGILDSLAASGYEIQGPKWKS